MHNEEINYTEHHYRGMIEGVKERERGGGVNKQSAITHYCNPSAACMFCSSSFFFVWYVFCYHYFYYTNFSLFLV